MFFRINWDYLCIGMYFVIELHCGTSPISMTPHRMAPVELQELKVQ